MIPSRVLVAMDVLGMLAVDYDEEGEKIGAGSLSSKERAASDAAATVLILWLSGEQEYRDKTPRRPRRARKRARRPSSGQAARRRR